MDHSNKENIRPTSRLHKQKVMHTEVCEDIEMEDYTTQKPPQQHEVGGHKRYLS
jgi:hypothetical protein